jgi:hypothetical protein
MKATPEMVKMRAEGQSYSAIAKKVGVVKSTVQKAFGAHPDARQTRAGGGAVPAKKAGRSLTEFRQTYDKDTIIPQRIRAALKAIGHGGWAYETEFTRSAEVSLMDLSAYRDMFAVYVVPIKKDGKRAWAGSKRTADEMRAMVS